MESLNIQKNIDLESQNLQVALEKVNNSIVTDIIIILDESASMILMGKEPVQSANGFIQEQKNNSDDDATITLVTFNIESTRVIDNQPISEAKILRDECYLPSGSTALNDAVCQTIDHKLQSEKPNNVVLLIITDGEENSSTTFSTDDTRGRIEMVQKDHDWKVMFIGANIDAFAEGQKISVLPYMCAQYDQNIPGNLNLLMKTTSEQVSEYRACRTFGLNEAELKAPQIKTHARESKIGNRSHHQPTADERFNTPLSEMIIREYNLRRNLTDAGLL